MRERTAKRDAAQIAALGVLWMSLQPGKAAEGPAVSTVARDSTVLASDGSLAVAWQRRFASPLDDWINQIVALSDGNHVAVGFLNRNDDGPSDWRALVVKFDPRGEILWQREHGSGGGVDAYWAIQEGAGGRLATAGFTTRMGAGGIDGHLAALDADGWIVKENAFGGPNYDRFTDIAAASDGGYVLAGFTEVGSDVKHRDILLLKTNATGIEEWRKTYGGPGSDVALYLEPTSDGGYVLSGGVSLTPGPESDSDMLVMKVDAKGALLWRKLIGSPETDDTNHSLAVHADGRILAVGYTESWGARENDMLAVTLTTGGAVLRHEIFGGAGDDRVMMARLDAAGRAWLTGYTKSAGAGGWDAFITRLDAGGGFEGFVSTLGGPADDEGTAILPLADGALLLGGYSSNLGGGRQDAFVARVEAPDWQSAHAQFKKQVVATAAPP